MEELKQVEIEYKKYREWGYSNYDSAKNAVDNVFKTIVKPHIYKDEYGDASYIRHNKNVLIFGDGIYCSL